MAKKIPIGLITLLTALNLLDYLDRYIIAAVGPSMQRDLHLTDATFGLLGSAFLWGYVLTSPFFGRLTERFSRKWIIGFGIGVWSLATILFGVFGSLVALILIRLVIGVGMAGFTAIAPTVVDDVAEPKQKGSVLGIFYAAIPIGSALGFIVGGVMEKNFGWESAFISAGIFGLLLTPFCFFMDEPKRKSQGASGSYLNDFKLLRTSKRYLWSIFGFAAQTFAVGGFAYWAPTFLERKFAYPAADASLIFGAIVVATGFLGTLSGGWIVDRMRGTDRIKNALLMSTIATIIGTPFAFLAVLAPASWLFFVSIAMVQLAVFATFSPINNVFLGSVPAAVRGTAMGGSIFIGRLLGDMISIWLVGALSVAWGSLTPAMLILPAALLVNIFLWWVGIRSPKHAAV